MMRCVVVSMHGTFTWSHGGCAHSERLIFGDFKLDVGGCAELFNTKVFAECWP